MEIFSEFLNSIFEFEIVFHTMKKAHFIMMIFMKNSDNSHFNVC